MSSRTLGFDDTLHAYLLEASLHEPAPPALPEDGRIVACDVSEEWTATGREHGQRAGVAHEIDLWLAPAVETLDAPLADDAAGRFDLAFIDADESGYRDYCARRVALVRTGGLIAVDNTLWSGRPADPHAADLQTDAIRAFNRALRDDERITLRLVPIGDGLTLARKRGTP